jgi:hypothetical protein
MRAYQDKIESCTSQLKNNTSTDQDKLESNIHELRKDIIAIRSAHTEFEEK